MRQDAQHCIQECLDCHRACLETLSYCIQQGGEHNEPDRLRLLMDCCDISQTCAQFMLRGSELHTFVCEAAAEVCQQCAEDCDQLSLDAQMRLCAEACRRAAEACQQMSA